MQFAVDAIEIFLQPGEVYFGDKSTRIRTVLGSCVAITLWHPRLKLGGMCHYMLGRRKRRASGELDGRYADEALQLLLREINVLGGNPREYQVKLFGGGNMFVHAPSGTGQQINVADDNVVAGRELLAQHGFAISAEQLGGQGHRQVIFEISSGDVWVRKHGISQGGPELNADTPSAKSDNP
jgi:chemotaxis protein CheD